MFPDKITGNIPVKLAFHWFGTVPEVALLLQLRLLPPKIFQAGQLLSQQHPSGHFHYKGKISSELT